MRIQTTHRLATAFLLALTLCPAASSLAGEDRFLFYRTSMKVPDAPPREGYTVITESAQVVFLPPRDAMVTPDTTAREIKIWYHDGRCFMKLIPSTNSPALARQAGWEKLRAVIQAREPGSEVSVAAACDNSSLPGCYFDVRRTTSANMKLVTRVAFVPYQDGMLEVSVTATEAKFPTQLFAFNSFLNCLHIDKPKPEIARAGN